MEFKTNCAIVFRGEHVRRGQVIEATSEEAASLGEDVTALEAIIPEVESTEEVIPFEDMSLQQLKESAKEFGLATTGSKADLQERIKLHSEATPEGTEREEITNS